MKMTYNDYSDAPYSKATKGNVKILNTTEKSVFVKCGEIRLRLRRSEIVKGAKTGAKIIRYGYREGYSFYFCITVVDAEMDDC